MILTNGSIQHFPGNGTLTIEAVLADIPEVGAPTTRVRYAVRLPDHHENGGQTFHEGNTLPALVELLPTYFPPVPVPVPAPDVRFTVDNARLDDLVNEFSELDFDGDFYVLPVADFARFEDMARCRGFSPGDDWQSADHQACLGCGSTPGEGLQASCSHPEGCGYWRSFETTPSV